MAPYDSNEGDRRMKPGEPSMSAPSPMPGKPAANTEIMLLNISIFFRKTAMLRQE